MQMDMNTVMQLTPMQIQQMNQQMNQMVPMDGYENFNAMSRKQEQQQWHAQKESKKSKTTDQTAEQEEADLGPQIWTVIVVDENAFKEHSKLREEVQKGLTSLRVKAFKSAVKCWHSIEKKARLDYYLFVCRAEEAITLARCMIAKHPQPSMLVYGGTPLLPFAYQFVETEQLVQRIAEWTGVEARKSDAFFDGINYTLLWVDEQSFKSHGATRKQSLEVMAGCVGVKTYKSADKCIRAATKKQRLENVAILVGEGEANELIAYLTSREENIPIIVESTATAKPHSKLDPKMYPNVEFIITQSWEESHEKVSDFAFSILKKNKAAEKEKRESVAEAEADNP